VFGEAFEMVAEGGSVAVLPTLLKRPTDQFDLTSGIDPATGKQSAPGRVAPSSCLGPRSHSLQGSTVGVE
jgi:hypothetical protein